MNIVEIILAEIKGSHLKQVSFCACPVCKEHLNGKVQQNSGIQSRQVLMSFSLSLSLFQLHSCQEMLSTQLENAVIELLSQFISADFGKLEKLKENQEIASLGKQCWSSCSEASFVYVLLHSPHVFAEHEQATIKYSRASKKRDSEKVFGICVVSIKWL